MVFTAQDFVPIPLDDYLFQNKYPVGFTNRILMLKMPVTQRQWREVMHEMPWDRVYDFNNGIGDDLLITLISRHLVMDFCRKVSMQIGKSIRLPTEAEWEFACRGGTSTHNYWGSDPAEYYDDRERILNEACFPYAIFKHHPDDLPPEKWTPELGCLDRVTGCRYNATVPAGRRHPGGAGTERLLVA